MEIIAFDSHKRYTVCCVQEENGRIVEEKRIEHQRGNIRKYLKKFTPGSPVAVETIGNWYWIVDEIEEAGMEAKLVHARKAKLMLGSVNKTDKLDALGLNKLQRAGTLPTVWIPPAGLRDKRDLARTRMFFSRQRTSIKNRVHSVLAKYGLHDFKGVSDIFGKKGKRFLRDKAKELPVQTGYTMEKLLEQIESLDETIDGIEDRMLEVFEKTPEVGLLMTMPGVGFLLGVVINQEIGDIVRFASPQRLASYSGTVPRVHSSGGKTRYGPLRSDVNHYLKWAFSEAGNSICVNRRYRPYRHTSKLYDRIRKRKGHAKAIGAVARHLSEAAYWILTKKEGYLERGKNTALSREA